jgi:hypothetical protein
LEEELNSGGVEALFEDSLENALNAVLEIVVDKIQHNSG